MAPTASPALLKTMLAGALCVVVALTGCADDTGENGGAGEAADGASTQDSDSGNGSSEPVMDSGVGSDVDSMADAEDPDDADAGDGSGGSADADDGSGLPDTTQEPSLLEALQPTLCLAAEVADEPELDSAALRGLPAELRRWAPLTALLVHAELPATDDVEGQALLAIRAQAAVDARQCVQVDCVLGALGYDADFRARLQTWLASHRTSLEAAQLATGLSVEPAPADSDEEWARATLELHVAALDAGLRVGLERLDVSALPAALAAAESAAPGSIDAAAVAIALEVARTADRDEAIRYEPHVEGENAVAFARLQTLDFDGWPYSVILVPGQGPTDDVTPLSPLGIERAELAVERLRAGLAPFVLLSGGHVQPDGTPWSEAMEMKRYLMQELGVPEDQIIVDPWARHTTTNLRNAARVLAHLGISMDRPILVTSDIFQSAYIAFLIADRSLEELGYIPWRALSSLGENDACAVLTRSSLRVDPTDPRDP
jgi:hypothetical protein